MVFEGKPCKVGTLILLFLRCCCKEIPCDDFFPTRVCLPDDDVVVLLLLLFFTLLDPPI